MTDQNSANHNVPPAPGPSAPYTQPPNPPSINIDDLRKEVISTLRTLVAETAIDSGLVTRLSRNLHQARAQNPSLVSQAAAAAAKNVAVSPPVTQDVAKLQRERDTALQVNAQLEKSILELHRKYTAVFSRAEAARNHLLSKEAAAAQGERIQENVNVQHQITKLETALAQARQRESYYAQCCATLRTINVSLQNKLRAYTGGQVQVSSTPSGHPQPQIQNQPTSSQPINPQMLLSPEHPPLQIQNQRSPSQPVKPQTLLSPGHPPSQIQNQPTPSQPIKPIILPSPSNSGRNFQPQVLPQGAASSLSVAQSVGRPSGWSEQPSPLGGARNGQRVSSAPLPQLADWYHQLLQHSQRQIASVQPSQTQPQQLRQPPVQWKPRGQPQMQQYNVSYIAPSLPQQQQPPQQSQQRSPRQFQQQSPQQSKQQLQQFQQQSPLQSQQQLQQFQQQSPLQSQQQLQQLQQQLQQFQQQSPLQSQQQLQQFQQQSPLQPQQRSPQQFQQQSPLQSQQRSLQQFQRQSPQQFQQPSQQFQQQSPLHSQQQSPLQSQQQSPLHSQQQSPQQSQQQSPQQQQSQQRSPQQSQQQPVRHIHPSDHRVKSNANVALDVPLGSPPPAFPLLFPASWTPGKPSPPQHPILAPKSAVLRTPPALKSPFTLGIDLKLDSSLTTVQEPPSPSHKVLEQKEPSSRISPEIIDLVSDDSADEVDMVLKPPKKRRKIEQDESVRTQSLSPIAQGGPNGTGFELDVEAGMLEVPPILDSRAQSTDAKVQEGATEDLGVDSMKENSVSLKEEEKDEEVQTQPTAMDAGHDHMDTSEPTTQALEVVDAQEQRSENPQGQQANIEPASHVQRMEGTDRSTALEKSQPGVPLDHSEILELLEFAFVAADADPSQKMCSFCRVRNQEDPEGWPIGTFDGSRSNELLGHLREVHGEVWSMIERSVRGEESSLGDVD